MASLVPGAGGYVFGRISAVSGALYFAENNGISAGQKRYFYFRITVWSLMAFLDNSYKKCYNKCNDDNKKAISHQSPKFTLQAAFPFRGIKSRRTPKNAVQRIYIKYGNTKSLKLCAVQGQREKSYLYIQKRHFVKSLSCGYKIVIILPIAFPP